MKNATWLLVLALAGCVEPDIHRDVTLGDVDLQTPSEAQLNAWQEEHRTGRTWRGDPRRVAHEELLVRIDVPWKGEAFDPTKYQFVETNPEHPDWGSYVVRGAPDPSGRTRRYRVKVSRWQDIWYARQVSRYTIVTMPDPFFDDNLPPSPR